MRTITYLAILLIMASSTLLASSSDAQAQSCAPSSTACSTSISPYACPTPSQPPWIDSAPVIYIDFWGWRNSDGGVCSDGTCTSDPYDTRAAIEQVFSTSQGLGINSRAFTWQLAQYFGTNYSEDPTTQYFSPPQSWLGGVWYDPSIPSFDGGINPLEEYAEISSTVAHFGITDNENAIIVLERGSTFPLQTACAFHGEVNAYFNGFTWPYVFADMDFSPEGACYNACGSSSALTVQQKLWCGAETALQHEIFEAITDPYPGAVAYGGLPAWAANSGWWNGYGQEIADPCANTDGTFVITSLASDQTNFVIPTVSDEAYSGGLCGACSYARIPFGDAFATGFSPYHLYHMKVTADQSVSTGTWVDWGNMGAPGYYLYGGTGSTSWAPGRTDVFARITDGTLRHDWVDSTNPGCPGPDTPVCNDSMGTPPTGWGLANGDPAMASWGPGHQDMFVNANYYGTNYILSISYDNFSMLWGSYFDDWSAWSPPSGVTFSDGLAVVEYSPGEVDLFGRDGNTIWHGVIAVTGGDTPGGTLTWSEWAGPATYDGTALNWTGRLQAAEWLPGHFDVFTLDSNTGYQWIWDCGSSGVCYAWPPPSDIHFTGAPGVARLGDYRLLVSARDSTSSQNIWMQLYDWARSTGGWLNEGGGIASQGAGMSSW